MTTTFILSFFGGVMLLLYGMRLAGEGLQKSAGARLRSILLTATSNRFKGVGIGAVITSLLQSSSTTTVLLVGFVGAGLLGLRDTMGVILGADIGTTLTVQLIAFNVYDYAIGLIGVGIFIMIVSGRGTARAIGQVVLGFGFIFYATRTLIITFNPLTQNPLLKDAILSFSSDPFAGIIVSAFLTALFQSSAATLALAISAAHSGLLTLDAAMPIVLGANIGTCVPAVLASFGATVDARRVALAHILFKVAGVVVVLPFLGLFTHLVGASATELPRQVANAHTFFNIAIAVLCLPFTVPFTNLIKLVMPEREGAERFGPMYLDPIVLATPSLALVQAAREALRSADIAEDMIKKSITVFQKNDMALLEKVEEMDDDIDLLDREVKLYLTKLSREGLTEEQARREMEIILFSSYMESIGDVIDKNLMELARKKIRGGLSFSPEGMQEIEQIHRKIIENFELGVAAFAGSDADLARKLIGRKAKLSELEMEYRQAHLNRLRKGLRESIDTSSIHLDLLTNLKRINSYVTNVAYQIVEKRKE